MLDREDMIALIEAVESYRRLNQIIITITDGYCISHSDFTALDNIYEVIKRNSRYYDESDYSVDQFNAIINAINVDAEEKYELLKEI